MIDALDFKPAAQQSNLRATIEDSVAAAIVSGGLAAGELVSVPALAARFEVSATPVREAMLNLEKLGFVEPVRNKGFRVTHVSVEELRQIVEVRQMLEVPIVRELAVEFPEAPRAELRELATQIDAASAAGDLPLYLAVDIEFHAKLLGLSGNERLVSIVTALRRQTRLTGLTEMLGSQELTASSREHADLLVLLESGKADEAAELMHRHIGHVVGWWAGLPEEA
ncbi:GntR family transcriptional regulator [Pseudoclavibacter sp. RFBJ3]|uniref:GntR family transcriptional regulator n=1 Tax=unclassified Pseudoclavibacter TaxID=2615177 RepID=UPI000CE8298C|nr:MULTISPECIES: GntR family transcriptional regulator [unclassified Pseudoclavibacter]PPF84036.1 GntR family transcriptional regulator [Pseudoclavibacter sp. RFBJ5]PPF92316.1 GntR family transcriptional regulator [Pseudoclavibacter sp. RFBJ3]PPF97179.1 GntR family transcriptional regulator [Pseudoclavibacter sp. RFBH5]PPG23866.1 GntR family transcriptional regulator [Pseudoclavibacter sp. RFBI4]